MKSKTLAYSKEFYSKSILDKAIIDYSKIARIVLNNNDSEHYSCEFSKCVVDIDKVINEFNNYLIELMNSKGE